MLKKLCPTVLLALTGLIGCNGINVQPQRVGATAVVAGLDGLSRETAQTFVLRHDVGLPDTERLVARRLTISQVRDFDVSVTRTGIPIEETFLLLNIFRPGFGPGSTVPQPTVVSQDPSYILDHVGRMVSLGVDTGRADSVLSRRLHGAIQGRQRTGYALFARWHRDDPCMPFVKPDAPIDVQRLASTIFDALSQAIRRADQASNQFRLSGPANDGDFALFFVPHTLAVRAGTSFNGFTLIFRATIVAGLVSADVFVPISILFVPLDQQSLDARIDLIDFGQTSDDKKRITVIADGAFETATGALIRQAVINAIDTIPAAQRDHIRTGASAFAFALNEIRGNQGVLRAATRVVMFPGTVADQPRNQILPTGLRPTLCILN